MSGYRNSKKPLRFGRESKPRAEGRASESLTAVQKLAAGTPPLRHEQRRVIVNGIVEMQAAKR